eukprot:SAG22_NODE_2744_length_2258_cov_45.750347_2_plen_94_part_00
MRSVPLAQERPDGTMALASPCPFILVKPAEMDLARHVLDFSRTLLAVEKDLFPNRTCDFMYQLSQTFSKFYNACQVSCKALPVFLLCFHCLSN